MGKLVSPLAASCSDMNGTVDLESEHSRQESLTGSVCAAHDDLTAQSVRHLPPPVQRPAKRQQHSSKSGTTAASKRAERIRFLEQSVPEITEHFDLLFKIGEGTFSSVYAASLKEHPESKVALKYLVPTSSSVRIENEIKCLQMMGGKDNVITLKSCVRHCDHVVLIMPYFPHDRFQDYLPHVTVQEVQEYMKALFLALKNVHSHHIIHRDIKPSNFLYDRERNRFQLVDFGLAHLEPSIANTKMLQKTTKTTGSNPPLTYQRQAQQRVLTRRTKAASSFVVDGGKERTGESSGRGTDSSMKGDLCPLRHRSEEVCDYCMHRNHQTAPRAGTPGFRAPEVLLKHPNQTTAVDIWSAGVILLSLLSGCYPFFKAHDDRSAMAQVIALMGSHECITAAREYGKELVCAPESPQVDLKKLCQSLRTSLHRSSDAESFKSPSKRLRLCNGESVTPDNEPSKHSTTPLRSSARRKGSKKSTSKTTPCRLPKAKEVESSSSSSWENVPESAYELLNRCLDLNPTTRITAEQALSHPFIVNR